MKKSIVLSLVLAGLLFFVPGCNKNDSEVNPAAENQRSTLTVNQDIKNRTPDPIGSGGSVIEKSDAVEKTVVENGDKKEQIHFIISKDFGQEKLLARKINYQKDMSVMDGLLEAGAKVKTSYGGEFVSGINGLNSDTAGVAGERKDWFYYVNGIFADVGALDYFPQPGEIIWWDYHPWKMSQGTPAVVGCFPEPFLHGFRGQNKKTIILHVAGDEEAGMKFQRALQSYGVSEIDVKEINAGLLTKRKGPTVIIGEWEELRKISWIEELNDAYQRNGMFIHFRENDLELLNFRGEATRILQDSTGVIAATGEGSGDDSPLWIISGTDKRGTEAALGMLIKHPEKIFAAYSIAVSSEEIIRLPLLR